MTRSAAEVQARATFDTWSDSLRDANSVIRAATEHLKTIKNEAYEARWEARVKEKSEVKAAQDAINEAWWASEPIAREYNIASAKLIAVREADGVI